MQTRRQRVIKDEFENVQVRNAFDVFNWKKAIVIIQN